MRRLFTLWSILIACQLAYSQQEQIKYEQEDRVKSDQVPASALAFVADCGFTERIKWYREQSQNGRSFEAKVKQNGYRYSIEFDSLGQLEDVELDIKWDSIPQGTSSQIAQNLQTLFTRHRIQKIQLQWTGSDENLKTLIRQEPLSQGYTITYEIVLRGTDPNGTQWYEMLFDEAGQLLRKSRFVPRNTDNLDY